jgi:GntR family transcriptional regulator
MSSDEARPGGKFVIDRDSPLPLYSQLKQILLEQILDGSFACDQPIPGEAELEKRYLVSRITVRRALGELATEGYLRRHPGKGTFVIQDGLQDRSGQLGGFAEDLRSRGFKVASKILLCDRRPAPQGVAQTLDVEIGQPLLFFQRLIYADGSPLALGTIYVNVGEEISFTPAELVSESVFILLEHKYGIALVRSEQSVEAAILFGDQAELLEAKPNSPALISSFTVYNTQGKPIVFGKAVYRGDRYTHCCTATR